MLQGNILQHKTNSDVHRAQASSRDGWRGQLRAMGKGSKLSPTGDMLESRPLLYQNWFSKRGCKSSLKWNIPTHKSWPWILKKKFFFKDQGWFNKPTEGGKRRDIHSLKETNDNEWILFGSSFKQTGKKAYSHTQYDKKSLNLIQTYWNFFKIKWHV